MYEAPEKHGHAYIRADLHVHTCLSPCGDSTMIPPRIREAALSAGIDMIAVTDHNSSENVRAVADACGPEIRVLGGMEITTSEEIHVIAICGDEESLTALQRDVYEHLTGENDPERFGEQYIVDHEGYIVDTNPHLLSGATDLSIDELIECIHRNHGLAIACHVDRESFSITSQLGFIPETLGLDAIEISRAGAFDHTDTRFPVVTGSDAHAPNEIGTAATRIWTAARDEDDGFMILASALADQAEESATMTDRETGRRVTPEYGG